MPENDIHFKGGLVVYLTKANGRLIQYDIKQKGEIRQLD